MGVLDTLNSLREGAATLWSGITGAPVEGSSQAKYEEYTANRDWERELLAAEMAYQQNKISAKEAMNFEAQQAAKQMAFQQTSAREAMDFEAAQAEINRSFQADQAAKTMAWEEAQANIARQYNTASAREAMEWSAAEAQKNRDWQTEMSNTAYQRAVQDLQKAGLNPILAALNGASTPSGSMGNAYAASTTGLTAGISSGSKASGFSASGAKGSGHSANYQKASSAKGIYSSSMGILGDIARGLLTIASTGTG